MIQVYEGDGVEHDPVLHRFIDASSLILDEGAHHSIRLMWRRHVTKSGFNLDVLWLHNSLDHRVIIVLPTPDGTRTFRGLLRNVNIVTDVPKDQNDYYEAVLLMRMDD